jgi:hypothetical membrane protein
LRTRPVHPFGGNSIGSLTIQVREKREKERLAFPVPYDLHCGCRSMDNARSSPRIALLGRKSGVGCARTPLSAALVAAAALMVLLDTLYFASLRPGYSHISNTISELGETGSSCASRVAFGFFLPVGLLVWLALWLMHREAPDRRGSLILAAMSCIGAGYALAGVFPCDPGAPLFGSWRTQVHNLFGFIDYGGSGIGFLLASRYFADRRAVFAAAVFLFAGVSTLLGLALLPLETVFCVRGAIQRATEAVQFTGLFFVCLLLTRQLRTSRGNPGTEQG